MRDGRVTMRGEEGDEDNATIRIVVGCTAMRSSGPRRGFRPPSFPIPRPLLLHSNSTGWPRYLENEDENENEDTTTTAAIFSFVRRRRSIRAWEPRRYHQH